MKTTKSKFDKEYKDVVTFLEKNRDMIFIGINDRNFVGCDNFWVRFLDLGKKIKTSLQTGLKSSNKKLFG
jgi:hypothetical protein